MFGIGVDQKHTLQWLFHQEKATLPGSQKVYVYSENALTLVIWRGTLQGCILRLKFPRLAADKVCMDRRSLHVCCARRSTVVPFLLVAGLLSPVVRAATRNTSLTVSATVAPRCNVALRTTAAAEVSCSLPVPYRIVVQTTDAHPAVTALEPMTDPILRKRNGQSSFPIGVFAASQRGDLPAFSPAAFVCSALILQPDPVTIAIVY